MLYYFKRTEIDADKAYVFISIREDHNEERIFMFEPLDEFLVEEKQQLEEVVPASGLVTATSKYNIVNIAYSKLEVSVLIRRVDDEYHV